MFSFVVTMEKHGSLFSFQCADTRLPIILTKGGIEISLVFNLNSTDARKFYTNVTCVNSTAF